MPVSGTLSSSTTGPKDNGTQLDTMLLTTIGSSRSKRAAFFGERGKGRRVGGWWWWGGEKGGRGVGGGGGAEVVLHEGGRRRVGGGEEGGEKEVQTRHLTKMSVYSHRILVAEHLGVKTPSIPATHDPALMAGVPLFSCNALTGEELSDQRLVN